MWHGRGVLLILTTWGTSLCGQESGSAPVVAPNSLHRAEAGEQTISNRPLQSAPDRPLTDLDRAVEQLKADRHSLSDLRQRLSAESAADEEKAGDRSAQLRFRLLELIEALAGRLAPVAEPAQSSEAAAKADDHTVTPPARVQPAHAASRTLDAGEVVDPRGLAQSLVRTGQYETALGRLAAIDRNSVTESDWLMVQYLTATCLRRLGKDKEANQIYREIAGSDQDEQLAECAKWHLGLSRWRQDVGSQLDALRQRRKALETSR